MTCLVLLNVGSAGAWWTTFPRSAGTSYSLSYAWEKVWQGTGLRSDKCPLQAVYRPRITGWSCSPSFANTALPTIFSIASRLPVSLVVHFHRQCAPSSFLHSQILPVSPWTALLAFLFYFYHYTFSVTCHHTKPGPSAFPDISLVKPCPFLYHELLPCSGLMTQRTSGC